MAIRSEAVKHTGKCSTRFPVGEASKQSHLFGARVFGPTQIEQSLPKKQAANWLAALEGKEPIEKEYLDLFAETLKEWALRHGATHFTHWFQPLTGAGAEKHDSFLAWEGEGKIIEQLKGKELLQGEPDASSFPSGGLRSTATARGYTVWDPSSPPFLWEEAGGFTLCIPSLFFSWKGEALDTKIPLLRSDQKMQEAALRLLKLAKMDAKRVFATLGPEQEYFAIDRDLFQQRPDLQLAGRTVYGARPPKGQELEDHYFSTVHERIMAFMREFEEKAILLGIPLKTRHNEVAPAQHEVAPLFERATLAADHNLLLMQVMRQSAAKQGLACLFHEKPFAALNGSGKHCNWSLATDTGINLLDPREDSFVFLVLLTAILRAVHEHAALLRCSIANTGNDWRLGGSEAPPTILSVYLGDQLQEIVEKIIHDRKESRGMCRAIDLGLSAMAPYQPDPSDRNRTSFFAFTGNKFEFRAVGASQSVAWPVAMMNAIVADRLQLLLDEVMDALASSQEANPLAAALPVLREHLKAAEPVLFSGDNYSREWEEEAELRGLPNVRKSFHSYAILKDPKTARIFQGILSSDELHSRFEVSVEQYAKQMMIECNLMIELFRTHIFPAALQQQKEWAQSVSLVSDLKIQVGLQTEMLNSFCKQIEEAMQAVNELETLKKQTEDLGWEARARVFCELGLLRMNKAREAVDRLEGIVSDALWPLPKYRELLFSATKES